MTARSCREESTGRTVARRAEESSYEGLAAEYYSERHVTSRNFDAATARSLARLSVRVPRQGWCLDIGAGRGRLNEFLGVSAHRIVQFDLSQAMLRQQPREAAAGRSVASASVLPLRSGSAVLAAAFLFDPFNDEALFSEVSRVLDHGGTFVATLPSFEWGVALRQDLGLPTNETEFVTDDGAVVRRRSKLMPVDELADQLISVGLNPVAVDRGSLGDIDQPISPHIELVARRKQIRASELPIIAVLIARRVGVQG